MEPQGDKQPGDLTTWPMGHLAFGAWITIRNHYYQDKLRARRPPPGSEGGGGVDPLATIMYELALLEDAGGRKEAGKELEDELVAALVDGRLPAWYEAQLRRLYDEDRASAYAVGVVDRGFEHLPWDGQLHGRLAGII
ncbi:hypothetical protein GPECTOR_4g804 [Gonium pectorale]|uniref:Uncharacterized protein n=1 Tax=Gonium pectorale TaxID=33097 RepID=A0A150GY44_GONPE|nr:hypothetical protein GPECTOR_4g804 [Gonium pectorale]|eukprot:KXZ54735.1 hypothetical protein GPECTOR_4g804 [Gonium pectorale]